MIISVASGKGGTGKTLVATSLALSLIDDYVVQILDCDVEEPNDHIFLKPTITSIEPVNIMIPQIDENKCTYCGECATVCAYHAISVFPSNVLVFPNLCHGCGACSYLCPEQAISEKERSIGTIESGHVNRIDFVQGKLDIGEAMPTPIVRKVKEKANFNGLVIIDVAPGTSCPVVEAIRGSDFCLLVAESTPFGLNDLILTVSTVKQLGVPFGIVINRSGIGNDVIEDYCLEHDVPLLMTIPFDLQIAHLYSKGIALVEGRPQWKRKFMELYLNISHEQNKRNCYLER